MAQSADASSVSAVADAALAAVAASVPAVAASAPTNAVPVVGIKRKWHMIEETNKLSFKGGYHAKSETVESRPFTIDGRGAKPFVHVAKKHDWLCKMAGGPLKRAGKILDEIREKFFQYEDATDASAVADANGESAVADAEEDPMTKCDGIRVDTPSPKQQRWKMGARGKVRTLEVPLFSRSAAPNNPATKVVTVNIIGDRGKGQMWMLHSDIPWLVAYLADEVGTGGVALAPAVAGDTAAADQSAVAGGSSSAGPKANCPDVPGLCIRLKPAAGNLDEYEARFVDGPLKDFMVTSKVSTMSQEKWDRLQATAASWQCPDPDFHSPAVKRRHKVSAVIQLLQLTMAKKLAAAQGNV
jgi:hypothetical protein